MTESEYLSNRLDDQITWYSKKASKNKYFHLWSKGLVIFLSSLIPLLAGISIDILPKDILLGTIGFIIAVLAGLSGLLKFQEKWSEYRTTSETLKHEKMLYETQTGPYDAIDEPFKLLVTRVENLISKENSAWSQYINKEL